MINTHRPSRPKMCPKSRGQNPPDDHDYASSLMHRGILEKKWSKPRFMSLDLGGCSPSMTNAKLRKTIEFTQYMLLLLFIRILAALMAKMLDGPQYTCMGRKLCF